MVILLGPRGFASAGNESLLYQSEDNIVNQIQ